MGKQVRFETSGALGILTLANPPLNLFSEELIEDLRGAVTAATQTPLRALMVRAEGKIFSGGADVRMFKARTSAHARELITSHLRTIADLEELPCPTGPTCGRGPAGGQGRSNRLPGCEQPGRYLPWR